MAALYFLRFAWLWLPEAAPSLGLHSRSCTLFILSLFNITLLLFIYRQEGCTILDSFIIGVHRRDEVGRPLPWAALYLPLFFFRGCIWDSSTPLAILSSSRHVQTLFVCPPFHSEQLDSTMRPSWFCMSSWGLWMYCALCGSSDHQRR